MPIIVRPEQKALLLNKLLLVQYKWKLFWAYGSMDSRFKKSDISVLVSLSMWTKKEFELFIVVPL